MVTESISHLAPERLVGVEETNLYTPWVVGLELLALGEVTESSTAKHNFSNYVLEGAWRRCSCVPSNHGGT